VCLLKIVLQRPFADLGVQAFDIHDRNEAKVPVSGLADYGEILAQSHRDPPSVTICRSW
jgi:hypothetical protein